MSVRQRLEGKRLARKMLEIANRRRLGTQEERQSLIRAEVCAVVITNGGGHHAAHAALEQLGSDLVLILDAGKRGRRESR